MKTIPAILFCILSMNLCHGQKRYIDLIEPGYTTRWDIEQAIGKGDYLKGEIMMPSQEQDFGMTGVFHSNGLDYHYTGITFVCDQDSELISAVRFQKPFKGAFRKNDTLVLGVTKLGEAFPDIDTFQMNTTGASNYWEFNYGQYAFYLLKPEKDRHKAHYSLTTPFKEMLAYYKDKPITYAVVRFDLPQHYDSLISNDLWYKKPMYAPMGERHENCYKMGWPTNISCFLIPFYGLLGGSKSEHIKEGRWKEYYPSHRLRYEGEYNDGKEVGVFKHYDENGKIIRTENHQSFSWKWGWIITSLVAILISLGCIIYRRTLR